MINIYIVYFYIINYITMEGREKYAFFRGYISLSNPYTRPIITLERWGLLWREYPLYTQAKNSDRLL